MKKIPKQFRQGDVLLQPVAEIPTDAIKVDGTKRIVLAEGEVTGHFHAISKPARKVESFQRGSVMYLKVKSPVQVTHDEHAAVTLEPGCYEVRRQVESWMDEVRQVAD